MTSNFSSNSKTVQIFSRLLPIFRMVLKMCGLIWMISRHLESLKLSQFFQMIFHYPKVPKLLDEIPFSGQFQILKLSGFFWVFANFSGGSKIVCIFPDDFPYSGASQSCLDSSRGDFPFLDSAKLSGFFQMISHLPNSSKMVSGKLGPGKSGPSPIWQQIGPLTFWCFCKLGPGSFGLNFTWHFDILMLKTLQDFL